MPHTLPQALLRQAHTRGSAVALRYKRLGIWQVRTWRNWPAMSASSPPHCTSGV